MAASKNLFLASLLLAILLREVGDNLKSELFEKFAFPREQYLYSVMFIVLMVVMAATAQCPEGKLDIAVVETGRTVAGKREWKVTVTNICFCTQSDLVLNCPDFSAAELIDHAVFRQVDHGLCLVRGGAPIYGEENVTFKYAADRQTRFSYSSSTISCS
ncbi:hypothetical protein EJ110_NYTH22905 [Nymphaea thermarum]|nr:hypothetical protein EJ110_NYTH22905 [Nymphaea thermarum]